MVGTDAAGALVADPAGMAVQPRRIMVAYDGSEAAGRALDAAADLVGYGSTLAVVTVQTGAGGDAAAESARELLLRRHVEARHLERRGDPAEQLVATAKELEADLLVVGFVSSHVVRSAPCDVLVVR